MKTFQELSERQQAACHAFAKKYGTTKEIVAGHLNDFFNLSEGIISYSDMEQILGFDLRDNQTLSMFGGAK